jgi:NADPH:quinone reductase-like Zn-dependent oxidoreductase
MFTDRPGTGEVGTTRAIRSTITADGRLEVSLDEVEVPTPGPDDVLIDVEAAPLNPSDLGVLLGPADVATLESAGTAERPTLTARVPDVALPGVVKRVGKALQVGNEGTGVVVAAGERVQELLGRRVGARSVGMYAGRVCVPAAQCIAAPVGLGPRDTAAMFVNPLTALAMVETVRREGHRALIHTAAASNLGQMINRLCLRDGIPLVNVVRRPEQARVLQEAGAEYVLDSSSPSFVPDLVAAIAGTRATVAFDAVGGGPLANTILHAMEQAFAAADDVYRPYGSPIFKQVYLYGRLDRNVTTIDASLGFAWAVSGFLVSTFLGSIPPEEVTRLQNRVTEELTTTFASSFTAEVSLADLVRPEVIAACAKRATGEKYLVVGAGRESGASALAG